MAVLFLILYLILITPVSLRADIRHDRQTDASITLRLWGIGHTIRIRSYRDRAGRHVTLLPRKPQASPRPASKRQMQRGMILLGTFLRSDRARSFLMRHVHLCRLHAAVCLALSDAAGTAMVTGLLNGLASMLPCRLRRKIVLRVRPDFFHDHTTFNARCILFFHLGTLWIVAAMVLAALLLEYREHRQSQAEEA